MVQVKKRKTADAWKKKEWYSIYSPKNFEEREVGTTPASYPENLINRIIEVPLREVTGNMTHQFIKMWFRVVEVKGKNAHTVFAGFELVREYLRRNVRRRRSMIRVVERVETSDGRKFIITVYTFTGRKIETSKKNIIRKMMVDAIRKIAKENNFDALIQKMVFGTMASEIFKEVKAVTQIKRVEISKCVIPSEK
jgi:small subunit ribosomal protein S3Ae